MVKLFLFFTLIYFKFSFEIDFYFNEPPFIKGLDLPLLNALKKADNDCQIFGSFYELTYQPIIDELVKAKAKNCQIHLFLESQDLDRNLTKAKLDYAPYQAYEMLKGVNIGLNLDNHSSKAHNKLLSLSPDFIFSGSLNLSSPGLLQSQNHVFTIKDQEIYQFVKDSLKSLNLKGELNTYKYFLNNQVFFCTPPRAICQFKLKQHLRDAKESIKLAMFSLTEPEILDILAYKHKQGLKLDLHLDDLNKGNKKLIGFLDLHKIPYRFDEKKGFLHHKVAVIDDQILVTGSTNFSNSGFSKNKENMWIFNSKAIVAKFLKAAPKDLFLDLKSVPTSYKVSEAQILAIYYQDKNLHILLKNFNKADFKLEVLTTPFKEIQEFQEIVSHENISLLSYKISYKREFLILLKNNFNANFSAFFNDLQKESKLFEYYQDILLPVKSKQRLSLKENNCFSPLYLGLFQECQLESLANFIK